MWPNWVFSLMWIVTGLLSLFLAWECIKDVNCKVACWWIARRNQQRITQWEGQRAARMREGVR